MDYEKARKRIERAAKHKERCAMFHMLLLLNAKELWGLDDAREVCRAMGMSPSYASDYRKIMALADMLERNGYIISRKLR